MHHALWIYGGSYIWLTGLKYLDFIIYNYHFHTIILKLSKDDGIPYCPEFSNIYLAFIFKSLSFLFMTKTELNIFVIDISMADCVNGLKS